MALAVRADPLPEGFIRALTDMGYRHMGSSPHALSGHGEWFLCYLGEEEAATRGKGFDLHVVSGPAREWLHDVVAFRDYLRENESERILYGSVKQELVGKTNAEYARRKKSVVEELKRRGRAWKKKSSAPPRPS